MKKETVPCAVLILFTIVWPGSTQVALLATVTGPDVLVTNGTNELHLTCKVANPSSVDRYEWFTPNPNTFRCGTTSKECTFTPTLLDNKKDVTCNSLDGSGKTLASATYKVNLKYSARELIGGILHCPDRWIEGKLVTLEFRLNISLFQHLCIDTDNSPFFFKKNSLERECIAHVATTRCGSFAPGTLGCGCTGRSKGNYVVQYNFIAHPDCNGSWSAGIICEDLLQVQQLNFTASNCDDKQVTLPDLCTICPSQGFTEGALSNFQCTINKDPFNRLCYGSVSFDFVSEAGVRVQWCWSDYENCSPSGLARPACNGCSCQCVRRSGNTFTYNLTFTAQLSHSNGSFLCDPTCAAAPGKPLPSFDHSACDRIAVATTTTTTAAPEVDDNSTQPGGKPNGNSTTPGDTESTSWNALGIGLGVTGGICVVMTVFGFCCFRKRRSGGQHNAPLDNALPANAPPANASLANAPPPHALQVSGGAGPSTEKTAHDSLDSEPDDSSVADSEASEGTEESLASEASEV